MTDSFVPVAQFLVHAEAWPLAGRLRSEDIDARVVSEPSSFYAYHRDTGGNYGRYMVIVPERDAARATWIIAGVWGTSEAQPSDPPSTTGIDTGSSSIPDEEGP